LSKYSEYLDILITKHNTITASIIFITIITCNQAPVLFAFATDFGDFVIGPRGGSK
jgi:hypothetical protein